MSSSVANDVPETSSEDDEGNDYSSPNDVENNNNNIKSIEYRRETSTKQAKIASMSSFLWLFRENRSCRINYFKC